MVRIISAFILLFANPIQASILDDCKGADLQNAARLVLGEEIQPSNPQARMKAIYLVGYIDGFINSDTWYSGLRKSETTILKRPEGGMKTVMEDVLNSMYEKGAVARASAEEVLEAFVTMKYGATPEHRTIGGNKMLSLTMEQFKKVAEEMKAEKPKQ